MAKETINEIISQEAFQQIEKLKTELNDLYGVMEKNIQVTSGLRDGLSKVTGAGDISSVVDSISKSSEKLAVATEKAAKKQKELKDESDRVSQALRENQNSLETHAAKSGQAGDKLKTLQRQIREVRNELSGEILAMTQLNDKIEKQKKLVDSLAQSTGKGSTEYAEATVQLQNLIKAQSQAAESIQVLQKQGGKLQDIYGDSSSKIKALSSDFANTDAAVQGVGVMIDSYTVLQSTMVGLGIESEGLMDIFAKLMILQQGINSVSQITKALQSESILRTKIESALMVLKSGYQKRMLAAQIANNAATAAGNVATGASIGIFKKAKMAIQAMNAALASNPWMLLAMAIIAAVAALIKFIGNQKAERVELLNKAIDTQNKILAKNKENLDKTVDVLRAWGVGEQQILDLKEAQIKADMAMAKSTMNRIRNDKDATAEQKNNATTAYNEQVKLWNDLQQEQKLFNIKKARDDAQAAKDAADKAKDAADKAKEERKKREKIIQESNRRILELDAKTETDKLNVTLEKLKAEKTEKLKEHKFTEAQKAVITLQYEKERNAVIEAFTESQREKRKQVLDEIRDLTKELNDWRINNESLTEEEIIAAYERNKEAEKQIITDNYNEKIKYLDMYSIEYIEVTNAYNLRIEMLEKQHQMNLTKIQEDGINKRLKGIIDFYDANEDEIITSTKNDEKQEEKIRQNKIASIDAQIAEMNNMTTWTQEDDKKHRQLQVDRDILIEQSADFQIKTNKALRDSRMQATQEMVGGFAALGSAIAQNIKDEKERMRVEAAIALVQALVNQGIAIAQVVMDKGDPYTKAVRIVANVAAIAAAMVSATSAFRQAASAMPYAEGTDFHKGGDAIVGERYEPELVLMKNKPLIIDKPTFFKDMPIGTKVIPFSKMESGNNMLSMTETNDLLRAIKEKQTVSINVSDRVTSFINSKLGYTKILNSKFKA